MRPYTLFLGRSSVFYGYDSILLLYGANIL